MLFRRPCGLNGSGLSFPSSSNSRSMRSFAASNASRRLPSRRAHSLALLMPPPGSSHRAPVSGAVSLGEVLGVHLIVVTKTAHLVIEQEHISADVLVLGPLTRIPRAVHSQDD